MSLLPGQFLYFLKPLAILSGCTTLFTKDLVKNPEDRFFHEVAHMTLMKFKHYENALQLKRIMLFLEIVKVYV